MYKRQVEPLLSPAYSGALKTYYAADPMLLDFSPSAKEESVNKVNSWVEKATDGSIKRMVDAANVNEATRYNINANKIHKNKDITCAA